MNKLKNKIKTTLPPKTCSPAMFPVLHQPAFDTPFLPQYQHLIYQQDLFLSPPNLFTFTIPTASSLTQAKTPQRFPTILRIKRQILTISSPGHSLTAKVPPPTLDLCTCFSFYLECFGTSHPFPHTFTWSIPIEPSNLLLNARFPGGCPGLILISFSVEIPSPWS